MFKPGDVLAYLEPTTGYPVMCCFVDYARSDKSMCHVVLLEKDDSLSSSILKVPRDKLDFWTDNHSLSVVNHKKDILQQLFRRVYISEEYV